MQIDRGDPSGRGTADALLLAVREIMADVGRDPASRIVGLDSRLDTDLGLDSLSVAELLVRTEELLGVSLPDHTLASARTPRDLLTAAAMATDPEPVGDVAADLAPAGAGLRDTSTAAPLAPPGPVRVRSGGWPGRAVEVVYGIWALAVFGVLSVAGWLLVVLLPTVRLRWRVVRLIGHALAELVGVPVTIEGAHHLPRERPFVLVANHPSHLDPLVLTQLLEEPAVVTAVAELAEHPVLALGLRRMHSHLVARGDRVRGVADAEALTEVVRSGRTVVFFPEGRRSPTPGLEPFRMGAFVVAARSGAPVVPVAIRGTRAVLPVGRLLPRRASITVTVMPPVTTEEPGWRGAVELQRAARDRILHDSHEPDLA